MNINTLFIIAGVVLIVWIIAMYNGLVARRNQTKEAWGTVDTQLKRRYDLIPNLVETVKGYAKHEKSTLTELTAARTAAMKSSGVSGKQKSENALSESLKHIFAVAENYPTLKADSNFLELQRELADTESKIQAARQFYNQCVMDLNDKVAMFPSNIMAGLFGFKAEKFFELEPEKRKNIKVKF
ncbi:MAG: LemA family protein [Alphaproteobacteria bacterium]|nr:LemA family protein [Alphaproteobacteria bacterium]